MKLPPARLWLTWALGGVSGALVVGCGLLIGLDNDGAVVAEPNSSSSGGGGADGGPICGRACAPDECGLIDDGCGNAIECPGCGGDGFQCVAGRCRCDQISCESAGYECKVLAGRCNVAVQCGECTRASYKCTDERDADGKIIRQYCACRTTKCPDGSVQYPACGNASNGCNGTLICGSSSCPSYDDPNGQGVIDGVCGGGGAPNLCGPAPCVPIACEPGDCGRKSNGCDDVLECGECAPGDAGVPMVCGANGVANRCGCEKRDCGRLGYTCGTVDDGCGGRLECGTCDAPERCDETTHQCACTKTDLAQACAGKTCGYAPDGCRGMHVCGPPCPTP